METDSIQRQTKGKLLLIHNQMHMFPLSAHVFCFFLMETGSSFQMDKGASIQDHLPIASLNTNPYKASLLAIIGQQVVHQKSMYMLVRFLRHGGI